MAITRITKGVIKPNENYDTHNIVSTGIVTSVGLDVNGNADISGSLSVGGVLTYEDVTSIDSVGIITAQKDIHVGAGLSVVGVSTFTETVKFDKISDSISMADSLVHTGNTGTKLQFHVNAAELHTSGYQRLQINSGGNLIFKSPNNNTGEQPASLRWINENNAGDMGKISLIREAVSQAPGALAFYTSPNVDTSANSGRGDITERLRIASTGNVTIHKDLDVDGHTNLDNVSISGVVTASSYRGDGSQLTGIVAGLSTVSGVVNVANDLDVDGHTNLDNVSVGGAATITALNNAMPFKIATSKGSGGIGTYLFTNSVGRFDFNFENTYNGNWNTGSTFHTRLLWTAPNEPHTTPEVCSIFPNTASAGAGGSLHALEFNVTDNTSGLKRAYWMMHNRHQFYLNGNVTALDINSTLGVGVTSYIYHGYTGGASDTNTRFGFSGNHNIIFDTDGTERLRINNSSSTFAHNIIANGNIDLAGDIDVDGHTNLDNVSIAGVTTMTGNLTINSSSTARAIVLPDNKRIYFGDGEDFWIGSNGTNGEVSGSLWLYNHLYFYDNVLARFGNGSDLGINHNGSDSHIDNNTGSLYIDSADNIIFRTNPATERLRIDNVGTLLVAHTTKRNNFNSAASSEHAPIIQLEGTNQKRAISITSTNNNDGGILMLARQNGNPGTNTVVSSGDQIGRVDFQASGGTNMELAAQITAEVDGTPGDNDMPGRLLFKTTANGANNPTERLRIDSTGITTITSQSNEEIFRIQTSFGNSGAVQGKALMGFDHFSVSEKPAILIGSEEVGNASYMGNFVIKLKDAAATDDDPVERVRITNTGILQMSSGTVELQSHMVRVGNRTTSQINAGVSTSTGALTLNTSNNNLLYYANAQWNTVKKIGNDGSTQQLAARSAKALLDEGFTTSGVYWLDMHGAYSSGNAKRHYCLMDTSYDGGGWTLLYSMNHGNNFASGSNYSFSLNVGSNPSSVNDFIASNFGYDRRNTFTPAANDQFLIRRSDNNDWRRFVVSTWSPTANSVSNGWTTTNDTTGQNRGHPYYALGQMYDTSGNAVSGMVHFNGCAIGGNCNTGGGDGDGFGDHVNWSSGYSPYSCWGGAFNGQSNGGSPLYWGQNNQLSQGGSLYVQMFYRKAGTQ